MQAMQTLRQHSGHGSTTPAAAATTARPFWRLEEPGQPIVALQVQAPTAAAHSGAHGVDVVYPHGSTFGADLSIFSSFDGRSWADALTPSEWTPAGPGADVLEPTLLVRGELYQRTNQFLQSALAPSTATA